VVFAFAKGRKPEVAIVLERSGGILITCDSFQNWTTLAGWSFLGGLMMRHLVPAHGTVIENTAKEGLRVAIARGSRKRRTIVEIIAFFVRWTRKANRKVNFLTCRCLTDTSCAGSYNTVIGAVVRRRESVMKIRNVLRRFGSVALAALVGAAFAGCAPGMGTDGASTDEADPDEIVGANAVGRNMSVDGVVLVRTGARDSEITEAVRRQVRVLFGAAKGMDIGLGDREATAVDPQTFRRDTVTVVDTARPTAPTAQMLRVRYTYRDRAIVPRAMSSRRTIGTTTLAGDYNTYAQEVIDNCQTENRDWGASGIWYNYEPTASACQRLISAETTRINAERRRLTDRDHQVTVGEVNRHFLPVVMRFATIARATTRYPEYQRMFEDDRFVAYSFFGLDKADDPNDYGARNFFTFVRTMLSSNLNLRITAVSENTNLLDVSWAGRRIANVTYDRVIGWILDNRDYPTEVTYANRNAFRLQVLRQWRDHFVTLAMDSTVVINGTSHDVRIEVRGYYGDEEGSAAWGAARRYVAAFADADVFQYTGHSHLGAGPLDARNYRASNFPDRYQLFMINSCVSFNYYNDFFELHGGTQNLDAITNGLPVYLEGSGLSSARLIVALIDGRFRSYADVLGSMRINLPWESNYDASRVADGETDNQFTPTRFRMTLAGRPIATR